MPEDVITTAPLAAPVPVREYDAYLCAYLTKYRSDKPEWNAADLPTEAEARQFWTPGRIPMETQERLFYHTVRREDGGAYHPDENGKQIVILTPDGTTKPLGMLFYLPGQHKAALAEAKRRGIAD